MDLGLKGSVALVTGASGGIGRRVCERLHEEGAVVVAHGHTGVDRLAPWCDPLGLHTERADLSDDAEADALVDRIVARHGRLDVLIANAGRWPEPELPLHRTGAADLRRTVDDNLWSALWSARAFVRALARTGPRPDGRGASVVFTGSTAGRFGEAGHIAYATSKAALHGLMLTLKNEIVAVDPHARVNLVQPGWTVTDAVAAHVDEALVARVTATMPLRRIASVDDIAAAVLFLASPVAARHVSGEVLTVAGGMEGRLLRP
ncbi:MAG: SDR family oxidoreductase [Alphaproteobacteria bacterium]|nr:SDR family oxidoreductase [Alphaproteobacteria bacterium]